MKGARVVSCWRGRGSWHPSPGLHTCRVSGRVRSPLSLLLAAAREESPHCRLFHGSAAGRTCQAHSPSLATFWVQIQVCWVPGRRGQYESERCGDPGQMPVGFLLPPWRADPVTKVPHPEPVSPPGSSQGKPSPAATPLPALRSPRRVTDSGRGKMPW